MPRLSAAILAVALIAAPLTAAPLTASAENGAVNVEIDRLARVQLGGTASSVVIGNPQIADAYLVDSNTLFIVGKGYGVTEIAVVDRAGRTLFQREVVVDRGTTGSVRVWRGAQASETACGGSCTPSVRPVGSTER